MKTFPVLSVVLFLSLQEAFSQVSDNFSDGDFSADPSWWGTADRFIVNDSHQLQLNAAAAGTSWLSTGLPSAQAGGMEWEFLVKQSFSPSAANFGRFYLMSDQSDLSGDLNGYFLQFGEAGSNDAVELFRQSGTMTTSVCRAEATHIATAFEIRVKVTRLGADQWKLFIDYTGGADFIMEASGTDATYMSPLYAGVLCSYTISNATRFYFDDISVRTLDLPDNNPPELVSLEVMTSQSLKLIFSEPLGISSEAPRNYFVSPHPGQPASAGLLEDQRTVDLFFETPFSNGVEAVLVVENVADTAGNAMSRTESEFLYFREEAVGFRDIVISEIFSDPAPQVGLPDAEFIEIFNRSNKAIDLNGWRIADETSSVALSSFILQPGDYLILTSSNAASEFHAGKVLGLSSFPSLNNTRDKVTLKSDEGLTIDSLNYTTSWYRDDEKAEGGWSLELIDPMNICADQENWTAAEAPAGGTPGVQNSVYANKPDNFGPKLMSVVPVDSVTLGVSFDEKLEIEILSPEKITFNPPLEITAIQLAEGSSNTFTLVLSEPLRSGQTYIVTFGEIYDCPGNKIQPDFSQASFVLPDHAEPGDIIVNEVLFNPRPTGVDFVEVYNRSEKVIDIKNWSLRNSRSASGKSQTVITTANLLLHPGDYRVFTEDGNVLKGEYLMGREQTFSLTDLPGFNDDEGAVVLLDQMEQMVDSMFYVDKMHSSFVDDHEGISLERITFSGGANEMSNWRSASSVSGFATPGYVNSNVRIHTGADDGSVIVDPAIIQPHLAQHDFAQISYHFSRRGMMANVKVFDQQGRAVKAIAENELLGSEGFFRWDGDLDSGAQARTGYYLVWFQVFDAEGMVRTYRKRVAIF